MSHRNFQDLLDVADYNKERAQYEASVKTYSSELPPPKKISKPSVQSVSIQRFLEKRKLEEIAKANEERKKKELLLALRAQSSKNNKKAKIMASRTKDNDFSRIKLTEDEIESKKKIEMELQKKKLADKVQRMKARIEMEEKEKMLPKKRKRKHKEQESEESKDEIPNDQIKSISHDQKASKNVNRKPPPPSFKYEDLLKVAEVKQHEPIVIPKKKKEDEKLLTKKERRMYEEEQQRLKRKQERLEGKKTGVSKELSCKTTSVKSSSKKPVIVHVEKSNTALSHEKLKNSGSFKKPSNVKNFEKNLQTHNSSKINSNKSLNIQVEKSKCKEKHLLKNCDPEKKVLMKPSRIIEEKKANNNVSSKAPVMPIDTAALVDEIKKKVQDDVREMLEKEMAAKYEAKYASLMQNLKKATPEKAKPLTPVNNKPKTLPTKKPVNSNLRKEGGLKAVQSGEKIPPFKKAFHPNPYLAPPTRRLEPIRPQKPLPKRRLESDDEDEDDDDDMCDFIDDGPSTQYDEDYSKYIKEIFGYDRNKYKDIDDDDIMETSFAEQMKEETRSARLGLLEDIEEERKLKEQEKRRKMKLKK